MDQFSGATSQGRTYQTYLDTVTSLTPPADTLFAPFLFPIQYAHAQSAGAASPIFSDQSIKHDLALLTRAVGVPFLLLIDEGNVLGQKRILLEMIRNLFMSLPGFMLVLAGTPDLFPTMDDVFSPIVRQFKRVLLGEFESDDEVRDCIYRPLKQIGLDPDEVFDDESLDDLLSPNGLTARRPYEIRLLCHFMFRRFQRGITSQIELDQDCIDEVLAELGRAQDIARRPILATVARYRTDLLRALALLAPCSGHATLAELEFVHGVFALRPAPTDISLSNALDVFLTDGVFRLEGDKLVCLADDFESLYLKYYARRRDELLIFLDAPAQFLARVLATEIAFRTQLDVFPGYRSRTWPAVETTAKEIAGVFHDEHAAEAVSSASGRFLPWIYEHLLRAPHRGNTRVRLISILLKNDWMAERYWFVDRACRDVDYLRKFAEVVGRATSRGAEAALESEILECEAARTLKDLVQRTGNDSLRRDFARVQEGLMTDAYVSEHDLSAALEHARVSVTLSPSAGSLDQNNVAYVLMMGGESEKALLIFEAILSREVGPKAALPRYNRGVLRFRSGDFVRARADFEEVVELTASLSDKENACWRLVTLHEEAGKVIDREEQDVDLRVAAKRASALLSGGDLQGLQGS